MSKPATPPPELRWDDLFEAHPLAHYVYDPVTLRVLAVNAAALARYACSREHMLTLRRTDLLVPGQDRSFLQFLAELPASALAEPQPVWLERALDGRLMHADVRGLAVLYEGRPARLASVVDATERQQGAQALAETRAQVTALLEAIPDLWFVIDTELRYAEVSNPEHPSLSTPWADKKGRPIAESIDDASLAVVRQLIVAAHVTGQPQTYTYEMRIRSGALRSFEGRCVPLADGRTLKLIRDITEVAELERRFHAMSDAAPVGIFMTDPAGGCTYANQAWQQLYGLSAEDALGQGWSLVIHPDDRGAVYQNWLDSAAARQPFDMEFRLSRRDGSTRRVASRSNPILRVDGSVSGHVGTVVDVTQARELEAARRAQAVAEESGRRQASFMSRVSHELRTPLNAILGFGQLLRDAGLPAARTQAYAGHVVQAGQHMLALVDDLLQLQRLEQGRAPPQRQPVAVAALLASCAELLAPTAAAVDIVVSAASELRVPTDERCLRQVVLNLGSNAIKYGKPGEGRCRVVLAAEGEGDAVRISVSDNGAGMSPEQLARLFQPFERLGQEGGSLPGSGLGLVITRHLVQLLGGEVTLDSQPGRGTTAWVRLPV